MAKLKKILRIIAVTLIAVGLSAYLIYAMIDLSTPDPNEICENVELIIQKDCSQEFIDKKDVELILRSKHIYPKGRPMVRVESKAIESAIKENKFVSEAECYKTSTGKIVIKIKQRSPVIYIIPNGKDGYYMDKTGYIIPGTSYDSNTLIATGEITEKYAKDKLIEFSSYLQADEFWNNQVEQIYVYHERKNDPVVELVPRVGANIIYLGSIDEYDKKLRRLKIFYEKAMKTVGWNKYERINLEYNNQIICTKSSQEKK